MKTMSLKLPEELEETSRRCAASLAMGTDDANFLIENDLRSSETKIYRLQP